MQNHDSNSANLSTTTDKSLNCSGYTYHFKDAWIQELGWKGVILFSIIEGLTCSKGYVYASDKYLAKKCDVSISTIETGLKALEDKGWIFRNSYPVNVGSKRHIIVHSQALNYWRSYLSKPSIPKNVKDRFIKMFLPDSPSDSGTLEIEGSCSRTLEIEGSSPALEIDGSFPKGKEYLSKSKQADRASPLSSFSLLLRDELERSAITGSEKDTVLKYFGDNEDMIMKKDNSMAYIFKGINEGWLFDKACKAQEVQKKTSEKEEIWARNEAEAKKVYAKYKPLEQGFHLMIDEFLIQLSSNGSSTPLGFRDANFIKKLTRIGIKCDEYIQHSGQTNPVEKSWKAQEHILR